MDLYSGVDANGNLISDPNFRWHHSDQKNAVEVQNATNALNVALAYKQNEWNIQQWEREMQWNSPVNQLKLLQEAGLNPLFYGQGLGSNSRTQAPQSADLSVAGDFYQSQEQAKMANVASLLQGLGQGAMDINEQLIRQKELNLASDRLDIERNEARSRIILNYQKSSEVQANTKNLIKNLDVSDANIQKLQQEVAQSKYYCDLLDQQKRNEKLNADFLEKTFNTRVNRERLQNDLLSMNIGLTEQEKYKVAQEFLNEIEKTKFTKEQTTYQSLSNEIQRFMARNVEKLHLSDKEKSELLGTLYRWTNDVLKGASNFNPANDVWNEHQIGYGRSTRNPSDNPVFEGWTPFNHLPGSPD